MISEMFYRSKARFEWSLLLSLAGVGIGCGGGASSQPAAAVRQPAPVVAKLAITTASLPAGTYGQFYSAQLKATGGTPPYEWGVTSGDPLSVGLTLDFNTGALNGVLTGSSSFQAAVADAKLHIATANLTVNANSAPVKIITTVLPPATVQQPYSVALAVNQANNSAQFQLTSAPSSLPKGLALSASGMLSGTPPQAGSFNFSVSASAGGNSDQRNFTLEVRSQGVRNDQISTATPISNGAWNASISPYADPGDTANPDQDFYTLTASGGTYVSVNVFAQRLSPSSALQPVLAITDSSGATLQTCNDPGFAVAFNNPCLSDMTFTEFSLDPMLTLQVPGSGQKTIYLHLLDWRGDARPDMTYQLVVFGAN
jgi:hypothetical protein